MLTYPATPGVGPQWHNDGSFVMNTTTFLMQGLRIMHRTVRGVQALAPALKLPLHVSIDGPSPFGKGVWQGGRIGFRWDDGIPMQN
ncbi:hypothetical protein SAMN05216369_1385 [Marinobacter antarcticus]|uniref:Uncharacterized protein n=1 Tax=Marinobacter antarcticus TaxID=564117 RepID=A0A1M6RA62_9GAMM|nr:hypothetical protein [Marinobacter antarcticus]SHK29332.1 hypothetical protein SAMN05216369_1385 [Marinobacter antarcticus]